MREGTSNSHCHTVTMLTRRGLRSPMTIESATDGDVLLEHAGARPLYLPTLFSGLQSIEQAWSKIKQLLHAAKPAAWRPRNWPLSRPRPLSLPKMVPHGLNIVAARSFS